jgi:hypothetical protein
VKDTPVSRTPAAIATKPRRPMTHLSGRMWKSGPITR